ncbi:hypothetical protein G7074_14945 [Pedobacter sp. HDW13]|uniref:hypothetical protein n=1 Tax=Pedobacter sp. HDW13 TaxID=2714940 RepID=UPI00140C3755|nr:hypothetical protein [Pedobacter sp. HDW13]QIL40445.1 hypothetical protein G7074_14945 [Pedobacter sp. HDW13]
MYETNDAKAKALKEKERLEMQINQLISDFEQKWPDTKLIPISGIANNLPYNQQKGGRIQLFLNT